MILYKHQRSRYIANYNNGAKDLIFRDPSSAITFRNNVLVSFCAVRDP